MAHAMSVARAAHPVFYRCLSVLIRGLSFLFSLVTRHPPFVTARSARLKPPPTVDRVFESAALGLGRDTAALPRRYRVVRLDRGTIGRTMARLGARLGRWFFFRRRRTRFFLERSLHVGAKMSRGTPTRHRVKNPGRAYSSEKATSSLRTTLFLTARSSTRIM